MYKQLRHYGLLAGLEVRVHPHMLRHACGYELAEQGMDTRLIQDYLGHRNIRHTVHYTAGNAARFAQTWKKQRLPVVSEENEHYGMMSDTVAGVMRTITAQCQFALSVLCRHARRPAGYIIAGPTTMNGGDSHRQNAYSSTGVLRILFAT